MNLLITGAYGFLGSNLVRSLVLNDNYKIFLGVKSSSRNVRINEDIIRKTKIVYLDLLMDEKFFESEKITGIIHAANDYGRHSGITKVIKNNIVFPLELIDKASLFGLEFFVNFDSFFNKSKFKSNYLKVYTKSKNHLENWLKLYEEISIFNLKIEHMYGPYDSDSKFVQFILNELSTNKKSIDLTSGEQKRDFIYVDDVVSLVNEILLKYRKMDRKFYDLEVGTGVNYSIRHFVELMKHELKNCTTELNFGNLPMREDEILSSKANLKKIPKEFNWKAKTNLSVGLQKIISSKNA